jgi:hypothetical protein
MVSSKKKKEGGGGPLESSSLPSMFFFYCGHRITEVSRLVAKPCKLVPTSLRRRKLLKKVNVIEGCFVPCYWTHLYATSTNRPAQLGNMFVAVGDAELSNKMALYMKNQGVFTVLLVLMLLWGDSTIGSVLFVLHHRDC